MQWENILKNEGLGEDLPPEFPGDKVELGDGLGGKTEKEEEIEDSGEGHSKMCPLNLGNAMDGSIDQPNSKPVEEEFERRQE